MHVKIYSLITLIVLAFSALSCNKAETLVSETDGQITVTYNVTFDAQTKATGQGESANYVWCAVYKAEQTDGVVSYTLSDQPSLFPLNGGNAVCDVKMVRDQSYKVVFVAQHYEGTHPAYIIDPAQATLYMPQTAVANSDNYDLFGYVDTVEQFNGNGGKSITLSRMVSQINFVADETDLSEAAQEGKTPTHSKVNLGGVPEYISLLEGTPSESKVAVEYEKAQLTGTPNQLATVFCLSSPECNNISASLYIYIGEQCVKEYTAIAEIPTQTNYRTNIKVDYTF